MATITSTTTTAPGNFDGVDDDWYLKSAATFGALSLAAAVCSLAPPLVRCVTRRGFRCCCLSRCYSPVSASASAADGDGGTPDLDAAIGLNAGALRRVTTAGYTLWWFSISIGFTVYNKWLLNDWQGGSDFPATFSMVHMLLKGLFAALAIAVTRRPLYRISLRDFLLLACPIGLSTGMDVVLANISLVIVTMSFYTLVKSATLLVILAMVLCFGLDRFSWWLVAVCVVLVAGMVMTSFGETHFELLGLIIAFVSMVFGGLRWVLSEALLHDKALCGGRCRSTTARRTASSASSAPSSSPRAASDVELAPLGGGGGGSGGETVTAPPLATKPTRTIDALNLVLLIAPASFVSIIPFVVLVELPNLLAAYNDSTNAALEAGSSGTNIDANGSGDVFGSSPTLVDFFAVSAIGGILAFLLILVEIVLVQVTSSLTLSVLGVLKTLVQVLIAIFLFGDDLGLLKAFGMVVTLSGLLGYAFYKNRRNQLEAVAAAAAAAACADAADAAETAAVAGTAAADIHRLGHHGVETPAAAATAQRSEGGGAGEDCASRRPLGGGFEMVPHDRGGGAGAGGAGVVVGGGGGGSGGVGDGGAGGRVGGDGCRRRPGGAHLRHHRRPAGGVAVTAGAAVAPPAAPTTKPAAAAVGIDMSGSSNDDGSSTSSGSDSSSDSSSDDGGDGSEADGGA